MTHREGALTRFLRFFSSLKLGLTLLGFLGVTTIAGTLILQRPMAEEGQIEQVYAPQTIRLLDALGLFDVFHAWWFLVLLGLLGTNIVLASLERFPQAWRYFSRPHREADEWYVRRLPVVREIPLGVVKPEAALATAASVFRRKHFHPHPATLAKGTIYVEKHRTARLAPYVVHSSLIIIFAGAIVDGVWGYKGYVSLGPGMSVERVEPAGPRGVSRPLPFTLRCEGAGMEKYADGSPKQYWTQLVVEENGREVLRKRIHVNEPLTHRGIRFFQSSYGSTGVPTQLEIEASWLNGKTPLQKITLRPDQPILLADGSRIQLANFVPDFVLEGNQISTRSNDPNNPAVHLALTQPDGSRASVWFFSSSPQMNYPADPGIRFRLQGVEMGYFSGLQVAKQPGKGLIWGGCLMLSLGLMLALYMVHIRIWGIVTRDARGKAILLLGGHPNKYRHSFQEQFNKLADAVKEEFRVSVAVAQPERIPA